MLQQLVPVILKSVCSYSLLLILGRIVGRKMLSRITFFDFVIGVTFGSLVTHIALGSDRSMRSGVTAALTITFLTVMTDFLNLASPGFRKLEEGQPIVLIRRGQILDRNLKKARISIEKLAMLLRQKNVFDLGDVNFAILESDGQLSVLPRLSKQPVTTGDLGLDGTADSPALDLIIDGKIQYRNLKERGLDEKWISDQLARRNISELKDVFYAGIQPSGNLYVSVRTKTGRG